MTSAVGAPSEPRTISGSMQKSNAIPSPIRLFASRRRMQPGRLRDGALQAAAHGKNVVAEDSIVGDYEAGTEIDAPGVGGFTHERGGRPAPI
jgi:hypothetical protein